MVRTVAMVAWLGANVATMLANEHAVQQPQGRFVGHTQMQDRVPVLASAPLAEDRRAAEFQDHVLLQAREQICIGRLHRQGQPSKVCPCSPSGSNKTSFCLPIYPVRAAQGNQGCA